MTNDHIRTNDLVQNVRESVGCSPVPVYRELENLCNSNIIKKIDTNKTNVEYVYEDTIDKIDIFLKQLELKSSEHKKQFKIIHERQRDYTKKQLLTYFFYVLQSIENTRMELKLLEFMSPIKNESKRIIKIHKEFDHSYKSIMGIITHRGNKEKHDIINELLSQLRYNSHNFQKQAEQELTNTFLEKHSSSKN